MLQTNSEILNSKIARAEVLKLLSDVPEFILICIDIGKKLGLLCLTQGALEAVTKERAKFLHAAIDMMLESQMSRLLGVPDTVARVARAMGHSESGMAEYEVAANTGHCHWVGILNLLRYVVRWRYHQNAVGYTSLHGKPKYNQIFTAVF